MTAVAATPPAMAPNITSGDRLGLTIFFAIVVHSLIILGVSFSKYDRGKLPEKLPGLEITLVQTQTDKKIEDADFLAQANQEGGGEKSDELERPSSPIDPSLASGEVGEATEVVPETEIATATDPQNKEILTATSKSEHKIALQQASTDIPTDRRNVTSKQLLKQSKVMARLSAEVDVSRKVTSKKPRKKFVANTKETKFATYEEAWRKKVERIGTLNFPDQAARDKLFGTLRMSVTVAADGSVREIKITKYSGHKILDDAAVRIVKMAAPFARFPDDISKDFDEIVIIRTWQFLSGERLKTRR